MVQKESSDIMFIFEPQCHTLVTFFLNLPIGILGQVWYLIVSIPDLCTITYFYKKSGAKRLGLKSGAKRLGSWGETTRV